MNERLLNEGNEAYKKDDYSNAILSYEAAFKLVTDANKSKFRPVLPMLASCYRKIQSPRSVIELANDAKAKLSRDFITSFFLTSVAAAYADLREFSNAWICVKAAICLENGRISGPLQLVIDRLEK